MSFLTHYKLLTFTPSEGKSGPKSTSRSHKDVVDWKSLKKNRIYLFSIKQKGKTDQSRMEGKYLGEIRADSLTPSKKPPNSDGNTTQDNIDGKLAEVIDGKLAEVAKIVERLNTLNATVESYNMQLRAEPKLSAPRMANLRHLINSMIQQMIELKKQRKNLLGNLKEQRSKLLFMESF